MNERLLQFIWQFQYFNTSELTTVSGETVHIMYAGHYNTNQGPDFTDAKIKIEHTTWAGSVELHIVKSDWEKHKHQHDKNYDNVILHVVWEDDGSRNSVPAKTGQSSLLPVLELKGRVSGLLLERYEELMNSSHFIPCEKLIHTVKDITWKSWKDRLLAERLLRKARIIELLSEQTNFHWEEVLWWTLAKNFGSTVNAVAFEAISRSLPLKILAKHRSQIHQLEALLLGQAGLLNDRFEEDYPKLLQREYKFLQEKYKLKPIHQPVHFLRMRPGNFPTVRLAQLAMLLQNSANLFAKTCELSDAKDIRQIFDVTANDYWHYHYRFDETSSFKKKNLGQAMIDNIMINTVCPLLFAYGNYHSEQLYKDKALKWLEETGAESNNIIKGFQQLGMENKNAFDSQALIELKNEYCGKKRCLECGVGNALLKQN
jgi:hypothetical protein